MIDFKYRIINDGILFNIINSKKLGFLEYIDYFYEETSVSYLLIKEKGIYNTYIVFKNTPLYLVIPNLIYNELIAPIEIEATTWFRKVTIIELVDDILYCTVNARFVGFTKSDMEYEELLTRYNIKLIETQ